MADAEERLIDGRYAVNVARKIPGAGGGLEAYRVRDTRSGGAHLMALQVTPNNPPRGVAIARLTHVAAAGVVLPVAHGAAPGPDGRDGYFVICNSPPGPALTATGGAWSETALIENVLRPIAGALALLETNDVTHRAVRPDNLFSIGAKQPAVLGAAWAAPPASLQPAVFEPPYVGMCMPSARGDGLIADDVYALGVTLVALTTGRPPLAGLSDVEVIKRKLELGSFAAIVGDVRLPPIIDDLVHGMLAEDPTHRPPPAMLLDISAARSRRLALKPPRKAHRPLQVASIAAGDARALAYAMAVHPEEGMRLLRGGMIDHWLRRVLRDLPLGARIDEVLRQRSGAAGPEDARASGMLAMQVIALLDPLAPLTWQGVAVWPSGLGTALASEQRRQDVSAKLEELVEQEAVTVWAASRPGCDAYGHRQLALQWRGWLNSRANGGMARLRYELNPLLACGSPLLAQSWVANVADLLPALEVASTSPDIRKLAPIDANIAAFISAHRNDRLSGEGPIGEGPGSEGLLAEAVGGRKLNDPDSMHSPLRAQLRVLARMQTRLATPRPLPGLAGWIAEQAGPMLESWHNRGKRAQLQQALTSIARTGQLPALVALLDDPQARAADKQGLQTATEAVARVDAEIKAIVSGAAQRRLNARRLGHEIAAGLGLTTLALVLASMALG